MLRATQQTVAVIQYQGDHLDFLAMEDLEAMMEPILLVVHMEGEDLQVVLEVVDLLESCGLVI